MSSTRTVVLDGRLNRSDSASSVNTRTSMFLKKLTLLRTGRRVSLNDDMDAFSPNAHAVHLGNKAFNMSQPMLGVRMNIDNEDTSDVSPTCSSPTSGSHKQPDSATSAAPAHPLPAVHSDSGTPARPDAPVGLPSTSQTPSLPAVDGLPRSGSGDAQQPPKPQLVEEIFVVSKPHTNEAASARSIAATTSAKSALSDSDSHSSSDIFHDAFECCGKPSCEHTSPARNAAHATSGTPARAADSLKAENTNTTSPQIPQIFAILNPALPHTTQSLPSRNLLSPNATPVLLASSAAVPAFPEVVYTASPSNSVGSTTPRALHPRLASLPPPMMARYTTQGSARLTPSIISRPPPMPIMNLPTLPPPTPPPPTSPAAVSSPMRLRSMPALPHRGPSDIDVEPADRENADLDDLMDDLEEEDEEEEQDEQEAEGGSEEGASSPSLDMEVPSMGRRLRVPLPPSISRTPRGELPQIATSPFEVSFRDNLNAKSKGAAAAEGSNAESSNMTANRGTQYFTPTEPVPPVDLASPTPLASVAKVPTIQTDYFNAKGEEPLSATTTAHADPTRTPRQGDFSPVIPRTVPMPHSSPRPGLYHLGSKSMVDLLSVSRKEKEKEVIRSSVHEKRISRAPDYLLATTRDSPDHEDGHSTSEDRPTTQLRRQRSLPMYTTATEPPPYPSFSPFRSLPPPIVPREEEGMEHLPKYKNSIYLAAIMPRKLEFTAPGVQSRDRKWRRALCVLDGTMFKVYKVHVGVVEEWWERAVGVGDKTSIDPTAMSAAGTIRVSAIRESERQLASRQGEGHGKEDVSPNPEQESSTSSSPAPCSSTPPTRSKLASLLHPSRSSREKSHLLSVNISASRSRLSMDTGPRTPLATSPRRQSLDSSRSLGASRTSGSSSSDHLSTSGMSNVSSATSMSRLSGSQSPPATSHFSSLSSSTSCLEQEPDSKDLLRKYTLQNAESGLASDYLKRKNVIRVRMEGEQFLLQAKDVPAVIDWIEGIQAATNIALDLDDRPMPKGPMFPRRRRRRPRRAEGQAGASGAGGGSQASSSNSPPRTSRS